MPHRKLLLDALKTYSTNYDSEKAFINEIIGFIEGNEDCFERSNSAGHITGSAFLLSPDGNKVLLTHHKKLSRWLQLGGHSGGDSNTWNVALKEAEEESGIDKISFVLKDVFDIDIQTVPTSVKKDVSEHKHYDVRFLLQASTEDFVISEESNSLEWVTSEDLSQMFQRGETDISIQRMHEKWIARKNNVIQRSVAT
ncbi:MAG: NUDIX hydrolase [Proteobacteria bacterium]|nr:NUDIX hydrolase [Pseudomonadota bacterium]